MPAGLGRVGKLRHIAVEPFKPTNVGRLQIGKVRAGRACIARHKIRARAKIGDWLAVGFGEKDLPLSVAGPGETFRQNVGVDHRHFVRRAIAAPRADQGDDAIAIFNEVVQHGEQRRRPRVSAKAALNGNVVAVRLEIVGDLVAYMAKLARNAGYEAAASFPRHRALPPCYFRQAATKSVSLQPP
ncbi:hypothetical protein HB772_22245 (plasmid) [Sinorhizobium meliloti]|nr:hypothetical protein HB772_22245 [Sinorhizobium meliloti]